MKAALIALAAILLAGCTTTAEREVTYAVEDHAECVARGFPMADRNYSLCRLTLTQRRTAQQEAANARMKAFGAAMTAASRGMQGQAVTEPSHTPRRSPTPSLTCFKRNEVTSAFNKICYYDCLGSLTAHNVGSAEPCPLTIRR